VGGRQAGCEYSVYPSGRILIPQYGLGGGELPDTKKMLGRLEARFLSIFGKNGNDLDA
jgi:hypothetical protein